jgi:hypothetical protein
MEKNVGNKINAGVFSFKNEMHSIWFYISVFIIMFFSAVIVISSILFLFHFHIHQSIIPVAFIISVSVLWLSIKRDPRLKTLFVFSAVLCSFIVIAGLSLAISGFFYDSSWDGQDYHQPAIIALSDGWNPVYRDFPRSVTADTEAPLWIDHYPKASWILEANIYKITGFIEFGKSVNILFLFMTFFLVLSVLHKLPRLNIFIKLLFSFLIAGTPVFFYQFLSFYVDSLVSCIVISQFAVCALMLIDEKNNLYHWMLALLIMLAINTKFTGIVFSIVIVAGLLVFYFIKHKNIGGLLKTAFFYLCAGCISFVLIGANPYITNTINHGNPFHPVFGKEKKDVVTLQKPSNFRNMNTIESFCYSLFSESGTDHQPAVNQGFMPAKLKIPFTINKNEIRFSNSDPRTGGFGTLFSGMIAVSLLLFIIHLIRMLITKRIDLLLIHIGIIVWIVASVLVIPDSWWARWVPQFWILPFVIMILSMDFEASEEKDNNEKKRKFKDFLFVPVIALQILLPISGLVNNGIILTSYLGMNTMISTGERNVLDSIKNYKGDVAVLAFKFDGAAKARLHDIHIASYDIDYLYGTDYRNIFNCSTTFGLVTFGIPKIRKEELARLSQADMPVKAFVIEPPVTLPESVRAFSGIWKGKIAGIVDSILIVRKIDKDLSATVSFSIGEFKPLKIEKNQADFPAQIKTSPELSMIFNFTDSEITLLPDEERNSIGLIGSGKYAGCTGYLRKINPLKNRPYSDFSLVENNLPVPLFPSLPFPEKIEITPPEPSLPDSIKGFTGLWEGKLSDYQETAVVIKRISSTDADVILSWGSSGRISKAFVQTVAQVVPGDPPELYCSQYFGKIRLVPGVTGNTLEGRFFSMGNDCSSACLRKCRMTGEEQAGAGTDLTLNRSTNKK